MRIAQSRNYRAQSLAEYCKRVVLTDLPPGFRTTHNLREWPPHGGRDAQVEVQGRADRGGAKGKMSSASDRIIIVLYVVVMAAVIAGVDFAFFRNRFWERLIVNIGIVLVFAAFYSRFLRHP